MARGEAHPKEGGPHIEAEALAGRRLELLRDLDAVSSDAPGLDEAASSVLRVLSRHSIAVPFAALYLLDRDGGSARSIGAVGIDRCSPGTAPACIPLDDPASVWPLAAAVQSGRPLDGPGNAFVIPLGAASRAATGVLVVSVREGGAIEASDRTFVALLQSIVSSALARARPTASDARGGIDDGEPEDPTVAFRELADAAPAMLWVSDANHRCTFLSRAWCEYTGQTQADGLDFGWTRAIHPGDRARAAAEFAEASKRHQPFSLDYRLRRADGKHRWATDSARPRFGADGRFSGYVGSVVDVHERKVAQQALRVREELVRTKRELRRQSEHLGLLWETAAVIVTSEDPDTMLRRIFARIREGLELDTYLHFVVDESSRTLRRASYGGISAEQAESIERLAFGEGLSGAMALERRPIVADAIQQSDDPRVERLKAMGIRTFAGNPLIASGRLLGTLAFASHRRDAFRPDELEFLETISHYVTAAYEQFRLIEKLREADRKKDEFLATLAHELRNPLAPIRTGLRVLSLAPPDSPAAAHSLAVMERQSAQLTRLIDDLLDVSRITQGKLQVRKSYVELADVVQSALETARPFIDEARHDLDVTLPGEPVLLFADLTRLAQVVSNLLSNAAKYTPRGGKIDLVARKEGGAVVVSVRDNGLGIEPEMLERVFEKFTQIDRSVEPTYTGLGIGLTLVRSLVETHGGDVTVRSEGAGRGSEFVVRLPCVVGRFDVPAAAERPVEPPRGWAKRRVLVVDDNQDAAELLSVAVQMLGHEVRTAHDGAEALDVASAFLPEVVLMDLGMPRMNGYEAARRMRKEPWGERITIAALTGWGQEADKQKTREAGFDHHLVKPADPATLEAILRGDPAQR